MFFLYHNRSYRTGRVLARTLGITFARAAQRVPAETNILIRWGNAQPAPAQEEINSATAINNASDKLRAFRLLQEAGVRVPDFTTNPADTHPPHQCPRAEDLWFGRARRGFGGRDIQIFHPDDAEGPTPYSAAGVDFFTRYIEPKFEARIHVAFGEVIRVQKKYLEFPEHAASEYIRNYANGYRFKSPQRQLNNSRKEAAIRAVEALGLDFGAVDLLVGRADNQEYVLEVNTAPKCSPFTGRAYIEAFCRRLRECGCDIQPNFEALERLRNE